MGTVTNRSGQLVDPVLTNLAKKYTPHGFIADQVCPRLPVVKESGRWPVWTADDFHRVDVDPLVPDRAPTKEVDYGLTTAAYQAEEYALKVSISRRERENSDDHLSLEQTKVQAVQETLRLHHERRVAALLTVTGGVANSSTPSNNWNVDAATIESDVKTAKFEIWNDTGYMPNTIVIPTLVAGEIAFQQDIREILKYTVDGQRLLIEGDKILPSVLWGLRVIVPEVRQVTSAEGAATVSSEVWGDDVRVLYVNPAASKEVPSAAYTLVNREWEVKRWLEDDPEVTYIRPSEITDEVLVSADLVYVLQDLLS